jgi:hypothetical protein
MSWPSWLALSAVGLFIAYREFLHAWFLYQTRKRRRAQRRRGLRLVVSRKDVA